DPRTLAILANRNTACSYPENRFEFPSDRRASWMRFVSPIAAAIVLSMAAWRPTTPATGNASWPMWGGTPSRNMVNPTARGLPTQWNVSTKQNIAWVATVGSRCYGNPVVADGKVFVGTNNAFPR